MSKWIYTHDDGEQVELDITDEEGEALLAAQDQADEEDEGDDEDEGEPSREADTPEEFDRVEKVFRKERAAIRASSDATDLRLRRQSLERCLADARLSQIAHTRARDLLGEIEQRELRILAERPRGRGR